MSKAKPGYYFASYCPNCKGEVTLGKAPSPQEEEFPKTRSNLMTCPRCQTEHTYAPGEMVRGIVEE